MTCNLSAQDEDNNSSFADESFAKCSSLAEVISFKFLNSIYINIGNNQKPLMNTFKREMSGTIETTVKKNLQKMPHYNLRIVCACWVPAS